MRVHYVTRTHTVATVARVVPLAFLSKGEESASDVAGSASHSQSGTACHASL